MDAIMEMVNLEIGPLEKAYHEAKLYSETRVCPYRLKEM